MRRLLKKLLLLSAPFLLWLLVYCIWDPFCVLRHYSDYHGQGLAMNRDFMSTEFLLRDHGEQKYDSFILGNSRTLGFRSNEWAAYLPGRTSVFSYGSYSDSLFGIAGKVELLDSLGLPLRNVLLLLDNTSVIGTQDDPSPLLRKHPRVSHRSMLFFQFDLARAFFQLRTFWPTSSSAPNTVYFAPVSNDIILDSRERALARSEDDYYRERAAQLAPKPELEWGPVIRTEGQFQLFEKMAWVFRERKTRLKIVIAPQLQAIRLNPKDVAYLRAVFGRECVYDFSGLSDINGNPRNWYEPHHFRPRVGRQILREIYGHK